MEQAPKALIILFGRAPPYSCIQPYIRTAKAVCFTTAIINNHIDFKKSTSDVFLKIWNSGYLFQRQSSFLYDLLLTIIINQEDSTCMTIY